MLLRCLVIALFVGSIGAIAFAQSKEASRAYAADQAVTSEAFTVTLDPTNGVDPTSPVVLTNQATANAYTFKTLAAVMASLPRVIDHVVTVSIVSGSYSVNQAWLGNFFGRSVIGKSGLLLIKSASGLTRISGTSTYALASGDAEGVVFGADPGFTASQYARQFLRIASGTASGQLKPVRSHTTTSWSTAGRWSPVVDNTSVAELVEPSVTLTLTENVDVVALADGNRASTTPPEFAYGAIVFQGITFSASSNISMLIRGGRFGFDQVRFSRVQPQILEYALVRYGSVIVDGTSNQLSCILLAGNGFMRFTNTDSSLLVSRCTTQGINASCAEWPCGVSLNGASFESTNHGITIAGRYGNANLSQYIRGSTGSGYGVRLQRGAQAVVLMSDISSYPTGSGGAFLLDNSATAAWSDLDSDSDDWMIGARNSMIGSSTAP